MTQHDRAQLAVLILWSHYRRRSGPEEQGQILDAISDMLVLCDLRGYDVADMLRGAVICKQYEPLGRDEDGEEDIPPRPGSRQ